MKQLRVVGSMAVAVCVLAVCNARAVSTAAFTNFVTLSLTQTIQGNTNSVDVTNTSYAKPSRASHNTAGLIQELGGVTSHTFTSAAKLAYIEGGTGATGFAVIDGSTFVSVSNIISLNTTVSTNKVKSGIQNGSTGLSFPTISNVEIIELDYSDIGVGTGTLAFDLAGVATSTKTDTVPSSTTGAYTETFSAKLTGAGSGVSGTNSVPFIITGTASFSGKGDLVY